MSDTKVVEVFGGPMDGQTFPAAAQANFVTVANRAAMEALARLEIGKEVMIPYGELMTATTFPIRRDEASGRWRLIWHEGIDGDDGGPLDAAAGQ